MSITRDTKFSERNAKSWMVFTKTIYLERLRATCQPAIQKLPKHYYPLIDSALSDVDLPSEQLAKKYPHLKEKTPQEFLYDTIDSDRASYANLAVLRAQAEYKRTRVKLLGNDNSDIRVIKLQKEIEKLQEDIAYFS